jgi:protein-S-isoprenylcysteine O-methyltransferase Ste14
MMANRLSRWGVGPRILLTAAGYALLAGIATSFWPKVCLIRAVPHPVFVVVGSVLLLVGVPMLVVAVRAAMRAYNQDRLATTGIFGLTRDPVYAAWIVFIIPGLVLLSRSWPLLLTPVVAYIVFKRSIRRENDYLKQRFGDAYRDYRSRASGLLPWPKWMNKQEATAVLREYLEEYRRLSYNDLQAKIGHDRQFEVVAPSGVTYQVEIQVFQGSATRRELWVVGSIDDGGLRACFPLCESFDLAPTKDES